MLGLLDQGKNHGKVRESWMATFLDTLNIAQAAVLFVIYITILAQLHKPFPIDFWVEVGVLSCKHYQAIFSQNQLVMHFLREILGIWIYLDLVLYHLVFLNAQT